MTDTTTPIALFDAAIAALNAEDWSTAAELCDPVSLRAFRRRLVERCTPQPQSYTIDQLLEVFPGMQSDLDWYGVDEVGSDADPMARVRDELPSVASLDAFHELSPVATYTAWLEGHSARRQIQRLVESGHLSATAAADTAWRPAEEVRYIALGAIHDGERIAHVLYRHDIDDSGDWVECFTGMMTDLPADERELAAELSARGHPYVATCRRQADGRWALIADHMFLGVGAMHVPSMADEDEISDEASDDDF